MLFLTTVWTSRFNNTFYLIVNNKELTPWGSLLSRICIFPHFMLDNSVPCIYTIAMTRKSKELSPDRAREIGAACICFQLRKASRAVTRLYDGILKSTGLGANQFTILMAVYVLDPKTISHIAEVLNMERTTLTRNIRLMEKQGLISVTPDSDRRKRALCLTAKGRKALENALPFWEKAQAHVKDEVGQEQCNSLLAELSAFNAKRF